MSRARVIGRVRLLKLLGEGNLVTVSYGLNTTVSTHRPGAVYPLNLETEGTVRFDTFTKLCDEKLIEELPTYNQQPWHIHRYALHRDVRTEKAP